MSRADDSIPAISQRQFDLFVRLSRLVQQDQRPSPADVAAIPDLNQALDGYCRFFLAGDRLCVAMNAGALP